MKNTKFRIKAKFDKREALLGASYEILHRKGEKANRTLYIRIHPLPFVKVTLALDIDEFKK